MRLLCDYYAITMRLLRGGYSSDSGAETDDEESDDEDDDPDGDEHGDSSTQRLPRQQQWTDAEEATLREGVRSFGDGRWELIRDTYSERFQAGRTEEDLQRRWSGIMRGGEMEDRGPLPPSGSSAVPASASMSASMSASLFCGEAPFEEEAVADMSYSR